MSAAEDIDKANYLINKIETFLGQTAGNRAPGFEDETTMWLKVELANLYLQRAQVALIAEN